MKYTFLFFTFLSTLKCQDFNASELPANHTQQQKIKFFTFNTTPYPKLTLNKQTHKDFKKKSQNQKKTQKNNAHKPKVQKNQNKPLPTHFTSAFSKPSKETLKNIEIIYETYLKVLPLNPFIAIHKDLNKFLPDPTNKNLKYQ